jgi:predicted  nucleic acid-binding Zn-ribbon protein
VPEHPHEGEHVKADPFVQIRLLDLQAVDTTLVQLDHRRSALPELKELERLDARAAELHDDLVRVETEVGDLEREQTRIEADVEQVRQRAARDQQRLDSGAVGPKQMTELQHELTSLARRQGTLEDQILELMERREPLDGRREELTAEAAQVAAERERVAAARDAAVAEIDAEAAAARARREELVPTFPDDLLRLYEQVRARSGGTGAAALQHGQCQGCHLGLSPSDLATIRSAPVDEVLRCEECRRILVRTPESGL